MIPNYGMFGGNYPSYQPNYQQQAQPAQQDERIWVQNETSAEAYLVAPNSFVRLWDSSRPVFYEKRADSTGRPYPMDVFEYSRKSPNTAPVLSEPSNSIPKELDERLEALSERVEALTKRIESLEKTKTGGKANAKSVSDDTNV